MRRRMLLGAATLPLLQTMAACAQNAGASRGGASTLAGVPAPSAVAALELALRAYERESLETLQALLPANFVGRATFLENARATLAAQSQIRVRLLEVKTGNDNAGAHTVQARWEKQFIKTQGGQAALESGVLNALLRLKDGAWIVEVINPENPFVR
jgi:hypothetical protein